MEMSENIKTYLRVKSQEIPKDVFILGNTIKIGYQEASFDKIFNGATQQEVFRELSESFLIECMQGYNCTLFAYGQTGSGKTYTIQGNDDNVGLVQRSLWKLHKNSDLKISLSFVEIYNETMHDLLDSATSLCVREDPLSGVTIDNLTTVRSNSYEESIMFYVKGTKTRRTARTSVNAESSRSHSVFTIALEGNDGVISRFSKLCFVDLAGSERMIESEEVCAKETTSINMSLLCLGKVINKLGKSEDGHISYRESKLTFLLKNSLGGNCRLIMIGNVSLEYMSESMSTIQFLMRSKKVKNNAVVNSKVSGDFENIVENLRMLDKENQSLKARLTLSEGLEKEKLKFSEISQHHHGFKQIKNLVNDIMNIVEDLEETIRKIVDSDFDRSRMLLSRLHDHFLSICLERGEDIFARAKWGRKSEDNSVSFTNFHERD